MTAKEFAEQLPPLTNNPLPIMPPFLFNGLSTRVFPLRANLGTLQQLCDEYLNFVPHEAGYFRVVAPYVLAMILDYGQVAESVSRIGWFAQTEVFFSVPVEWYQLVGGRWVFKDWAVITPYIFVNDSFSVPLGRTVFGFPKILAKMMSPESAWTADPMAPVTLAQFATAVFPQPYKGTRLEDRIFLEIDRAAPMSNFRVPPDLLSPLMPWIVASNWADAMGGIARDLWWLAQAMRIFPINPLADPILSQEMAARVPAWFAPGGRGFIQNSLNLKQFRRADMPHRLCYQALTYGQMVTTGFNGAGLLGEERTVLGDFSGGYVVRLYDHASLPITSTLGLDVNRQWMTEDGRVSELIPVLPFWMSVNLSYSGGTNLAWRAEDGVWKDGGGQLLVPGWEPPEKAAAPEFNASVASALEAITGPFEFADTTIRVLPLLARRDAMQDFVDTFINQPLKDPIVRPDGVVEQVRLTVWNRPPAFVNKEPKPIGGDLGYVYLTASSFTDVISKTNNVGDWAKYELSFLIPVKWERLGADGAWQTVAVGVVPAFSFVDDCIAAISRCEVQGIDARTAVFVRPESVWLKEGQTKVAAEQTLLRVNCEVWPAFGAGQKAAMEPIIEVSRRVPNAGLGEDESRDTPYLWAETLRVELGTKKGTKARFPRDFQIGRALAIELLGNRTPFELYTLKQIRDVHDPNRACYQQLLRVPRVLSEVLDLRELEETVVVHIHDFPSLKIAETLGIVAPTVAEGGSGIVYSAQAIRPFYIRTTMTEPLAEPLLTRSGTTGWQLAPGAFQSMLSDELDSPELVADLEAEADQNQLDSCRMTFIMFQARERLRHGRGPGDPGDKFDKRSARGALARIDPQMVIDAVLSREWGNLDDDARWRRGRHALARHFGALPGNGPVDPAAESGLWTMVNNSLALRPGAVASPVPPKGPQVDPWQKVMADMLASEARFAQARIALEEAYAAIGPWLLLGVHEFESPANVGHLSPEQRLAALQKLFEALKTVKGLTVQREPSQGTVQAGVTRLDQLLQVIGDRLKSPADAHPDSLGNRIQDLLEAVELARSHCGAQREALLNRLSRAYQKPDFCILRDSVGTRSDELLAASLSWDKDWYFGKEIEPEDVPPPSIDFKTDGTRRVTSDRIGPRLL